MIIDMKKIFETMRGHLLRRVIFVLCALVIGITSSAQARIGFTAGVDINYPLTDALYQRPAPGYSLGIVGEYLFSNGFGIKAEVLDSDIRYGYTKLSFDDISAIQETKLNLISLPVQGIWKLSLKNGLALKAGIGLQYSRMLWGSAYVCDQYGQGDLWELDMDSTKGFDYPEYHEIRLKKVNNNLFSGIISLEVAGRHIGTGIYFNKGFNAFSKQAPFVSGSNQKKTLNRFGFKISYYL